LLGGIGLPLRFQATTFSDYDPKTPSQTAAARVAYVYGQAILVNLESGKGLTLWGSVGSGKTHLAVCVLKAAAGAGKSALYATEDGIFDSFKKAWDEPSQEIEYLRRLQNTRFLLIDDFGIRKPTDYVSDRYEAIINTRYANGLPTLITSNHSPEILAGVYERQMSRLAGNVVVEVLGPDARATAKVRIADVDRAASERRPGIPAYLPAKA